MIKPVQRDAQQGGFALLVVFLMAAMVAITLYLEIPRVAFESQRNREQMLVERGEQYKRAVELYYRKTKTYPQKIEDLENTNNFRFLRKRYKDPLTGKDEWRLVHMGPAGLTDSLVEKMPGLDGDKKGDKDKKEMASAATDPSQQVKGPDDITAGSNRTERDQRALMAQRGAGGAGGFGGDPNAAQQQPEDPNLAFQQQQLREFQQQQQQLQAGQTPPPGGLPIDATSAQNPGAPPMAQMQGNGAPPPGQFPFGQQQQQQQQNPFGQQQQPFPPVGSPNGPVRTLYQPGQLPFNPGNAMLRGAIPNPGGNVSSSQTGGFGQPYNQQQSAFGGASSGFGGSGSGNSSFNVPQAVRDQLTRPQGRPQQMGPGQQQFGGTGIAGVASNAGGSGIKRYNEKSKYKEWEFVFDYRKPAKGAQKGVTGVGGLKTTDGNSQQQPGSGFGNSNSSGFGNNNNSGFGSGFGGSGSSSGFGSNPRRP